MENVDETQNEESRITWIIVGTFAGLVLMIGFAVVVCLVWQRHSNNFRAWLLGIPFMVYFLGNRRDSLTSLEEEEGNAQYSQSLRQWRRGIPTTVGVKREGLPIKDTATSGYRWKKKWRERKARSKAKRKLKHEARKQRRAQKKAQEEEEQSSQNSDDESSEGDDEDGDDDDDGD